MKQPRIVVTIGRNVDSIRISPRCGCNDLELADADTRQDSPNAVQQRHAAEFRQRARCIGDDDDFSHARLLPARRMCVSRILDAHLSMSTAVAEKPGTQTKLHQLEQLKQFTKVVADTGDFSTMATFKPQDAT